MSRLRVVASLEELLEVDKLKAAEDQANKTGEYDALYNKVKQDQVTEEEERLKENDDDTSTPSEDVPSDDGNNSEPVSSDDPAGEADSETTEAVESFKGLTYSEESIAIATAGLDLVVMLGILGVKYTGKAAINIFKGIVLLFGAAAKIIYQSSQLVKKYLEKREASLDSIAKSITSLKKTLDEVRNSGEIKDPGEVKFTRKQTINSLKSGGSVDFSVNINQLTMFSEKFVGSLFRQIKHEQDLITHIVVSAKNSTKVPLDKMVVNVENIGLKEGTVEGYSVSSDVLTSYRSTIPLPSDIVVIGTFPSNSLEDKSLITKAYNESSLILGIDSKAFQTVEAVDYMTIDELSKFIEQMETLCNFLIIQRSNFERINHNKETLKVSLKNYFMSLADRSKKVSISDSFMDLVYLKIMISDKVYLTSLMDFQDYVSKVLVAGTSFAKENIKAMS